MHDLSGTGISGIMQKIIAAEGLVNYYQSEIGYFRFYKIGRSRPEMTAFTVFYICSINLSDHTAGITDGQRICRDILCHNASASDHGAVADGHHRAGRSRRRPARAVTDADWQGISAAEVLSGSGTPFRSQPVQSFLQDASPYRAAHWEAIRTSSPMVIVLQSTNVQFMFTDTLFPDGYFVHNRR